MTRENCRHCKDDVYNARPEGCPSFESAKLAKYLQIHVNDPPPYDRKALVELPTCHRRDRFVKVKPEALDMNGYWRRSA